MLQRIDQLKSRGVFDMTFAMFAPSSVTLNPAAAMETEISSASVFSAEVFTMALMNVLPQGTMGIWAVAFVCFQTRPDFDFRTLGEQILHVLQCQHACGAS